jgi:phosphate transport system substrate-binding protein
MHRKPISSGIAAIVSCFVIAFANMAHAETLRIGGTGVALGGMKLLGEAYEEQNPGVTVEVLPSLGSSGGIKALVAGAIDLAVSSRELKESETTQGAMAELYATTQLAVVTSLDTDIDGVTTAQLVDAYSGTSTQWPSGTPIRIVLRPVSEIDTQILRGLSEEMAKAVDLALERPGLVTATNDQDNASTLERLDGSLGLVAMGQIATEQRNLRVLSLDGKLPEVSDSSDAAAAFSKQLYLVKVPTTNALASDFQAFVFSEDGQAILAENGHRPVR